MIRMDFKTDNIKHSCGECVACCGYPEISDPLIGEKPFGSMCKHCTGKGCSIYKYRPQICRSFECLWKFGIINKSPLESKVVWGMDFDTVNNELVVFAQCEDALVFARNLTLLQEVNRLLSSCINNLLVGSVVVRSVSDVVEFRRVDDDRVSVKHCSVINGVPHHNVASSEILMSPIQL